nr:MAG TPA: hypothetical protein [Microviridae sp.]
MFKNNRVKLVFSVYSHELEDYPYYPFIADSVNQGIKKYIQFLNCKQSICEGAELHILGTCEQYFDKDGTHGVLENIQPFLFPQRVSFREDFLGRIISKLFVLSAVYGSKSVQYISKFLSKKGLKNGK